LAEKRKRAIVTGAASGIGKAAAQRMIKEGIDVVVADIKEKLIFL
jgi:NAD(P)-dependent dehydrogenase (short-subunit alcohol dehydrogenase family)